MVIFENTTIPCQKMITEKLNKAIQLINEGKLTPARDLILEELKSDPENLDAWLWALEAAVTEKEQRSILGRILALDPTHSAALVHLENLDRKGKKKRSPEPTSPGQSGQAKKQRPNRIRSNFAGLLNLSIDWAASLPSGCSFITIFLGIVLGVFIYTRVNTSLFGLTGADLDSLVISNSYEKITSEEFYWNLQFEGIGKTRYLGAVRHVAPIRIKEFSILTHDILVTSGDFSDPAVVRTNVIDHKFFWKSPNDSTPEGTINLIHAIPATKEIYQLMLDIHKWDTVLITGREIYKVKAFQTNDDFIGSWMDTGCNTLLVESVTILRNTP